MPRSPRTTKVLALALALGAVLASGDPALAQFGKNKIQYKVFEWQVYHSPHFDVYFYPDEEGQLQKLVSFAESAYDELSRRFDYQIQEATPLIIYLNHAQFEQNNIFSLGFVPEGVGAFATPVRFRMVMPIDLPDGELYELILHELTHIFQYHMLFGGGLARSLAANPPTWLVEGMASYYANDESSSDRMFLRDAVVNDLLPPITEARGGGFFAYRYGHAAFEFMEDRWGPEGVLDFLYEYRSTLGSQVGRAIKRAFRIEPEDFDADFRRWLRKKYLTQLVQTGEPSDFGRRFFGDKQLGGDFWSPAVSPSGDLVAAFGSAEGELDVFLFDTQDRRPLKNLTKGFTTETQQFIGQFATWRRRMGRDLAFSPDGNYIAALAKKENNRVLVLVDVLHGGIARTITLEPQQPFAPSWSPDGRTIAVSGNVGGDFDIYLVDVETGQATNVTADPRFDGGATFTPDGRWLVYSSEVDTYAKLFKLDLQDPSKRYQLTTGEYQDVDPMVAPDGNRLFFTSDRDGFDNVYELDLDSGTVKQRTNAVTGCFMPSLFSRADGSEGLVYGGYWRGDFDLFKADLEEPLAEQKVTLAENPVEPGQLKVFEPDIQVAIDKDNEEKHGGFKFFIEDLDVGVGVTSDNLVVGQSILRLSDFFGDRHFIVNLYSVAGFSVFDGIYLNARRRTQWGGHVFDHRSFVLGFNEAGALERVRTTYRLTGARAFASYPLSLNTRFEGGVAGISRHVGILGDFDRQRNELIIFNDEPRTDEYPEVSVGVVRDTTVFASWGPVKGQRWRIDASWAPDLDTSGTLTSTLQADFRQYVPFTKRTGFALRLFGTVNSGNFPTPIAFGGLDDFRGVDYLELGGDRGFYANFEVRFPLLDALRFPFFSFQGIRGRFFLDVAGAWYADLGDQTFRFWNSDENRLQDALSSYGWGFTIRFMGFDLHWDFAKLWDFKETLPAGFRTIFWIGPRF